MEPTKEELLRIYANGLKSRYLDEKLQKYYHQNPQNRNTGAMRHLYPAVGNEFGASTIAAFLRNEDYLIPRYRGYAAVLGKGLSAESIVAEIFGKKTGLTKGLGDAAFFPDPHCNIFGSSLILGSNFSVTIGLALTKKIKKEAGIVVQFFGDGEASRSSFGSALNLASLWGLPVLFVCENDNISLYSKIDEMSATPTIAERANGYRVESETIYETELLRLCERAKEIIAKTRKDSKPFLFEIIEKRYTSQSSRYDRKPFVAAMLPKSEDPLDLLEAELEKFGIADSVLVKLKNEAKRSIDAAISKAERAEPLSNEEFLSIYNE